MLFTPELVTTTVLSPVGTTATGTVEAAETFVTVMSVLGAVVATVGTTAAVASRLACRASEASTERVTQARSEQP